jgi:hypothetical protein
LAGSFRYRAFLSYSHSDEAAVSRLHRALERYAIPRRVRRAHALPARLIPIFRDVEELEAASGLTTRLQDAMDQSEWLIVVCSPAAAASRYVNEEVEYFLGKRGASHVLCALLDGEPADAFPPAIRALREEPLAADFRSGHDFELAKLKLIAAIASVGFNELRDREAQRRQRRNAIAALALGAAVTAPLVAWDLFYREHVQYFRDYERRDGIWKGIGEISEGDARHRSQNYRFMRHGRLNPPEEVRATTGLDTCRAWSLDSVLGTPLGDTNYFINSPACTATFQYGQDGHILREVKRNRAGFPLEGITYTSPEVAQFTLEGFGASGSSTGVYYVQFTRYKEGPMKGLERDIRFFFSRENPRPNESRHFGYRYEYDASGKRIRQVPLDGSGEPIAEAIAYRYDDKGQVIEELAQDLEGHPRQRSDGCHGERNRYDGAGNLVLATCIDANGNAGTNIHGVSNQEFGYDDRGNLVRERTLDAAGHPTRTARGVAEVRQVYDDRGWPIERASFDERGEPTIDDEGGHGWWIKHDAMGNDIEYTFFDTSRKVACIFTGVCIWRLEYDSRGLCIGQTYFSPDGHLMLISHGAGMKVKLDGRGNATEVTRLGLDGKAFLAPDLGYAIVRLRRNERGAVVERSFFDADGKPLAQKDGQAGARFEFDDLGNLVEGRFLDTKGELVRIVEGYAVARRKFDRLGQVTERTYYDERLQPVLHSDGYFGYQVRYDNRGQETERRYLGPDGRPFRSTRAGNFGVRYVRNTFGNVSTELFLDASGQPLGGSSFGRIDYRYNEHLREIEKSYWTGDGKPASAPVTHCSVYRTEYDSTGRTTAERCLDASGHPFNRADSGWASKTIEYDTGRKMKERLADAQGRDVSQPPARARASR